MPFKSRERGSRPDVVWDRVPYFAPTKEKLLLLANSVLYFGRRSLFSLSRSE